MTSRFSTGLSNFHLVGMVSSLIFSLNLLTQKPQKIYGEVSNMLFVHAQEVFDTIWLDRLAACES